MPMTDIDTTPVSGYIDEHKWPCRFCLVDLVDVWCHDHTYMKIAADTDPAKFVLNEHPHAAHKALMFAPISHDLPQHKYAIAVAAQDLLEHLCDEGKHFRLGMKALAQNRRLDIRSPREMSDLGASGTDVPDPDGDPGRFVR